MANNNRVVGKASPCLAQFICKQFYDCFDCFSSSQTINDVIRICPDFPSKHSMTECERCSTMQKKKITSLTNSIIMERAWCELLKLN